MTIEKEDFDQWRGHPVTEEVFRALLVLGERAKQKWIDTSWGGGDANPMMLVDLRARAEVVNDLREMTYEELEEALNEK